MCADDIFRFIRLTLLEGFAHAHDRFQAGGERRLGLGVDEGIAFLLVFAPFGMAKNHVVHTQIAQHAGVDLAGVCAVIVRAHVLRAHLDEAVGQRVADGFQRGEWRANHHVHIRLCAHRLVQGADQFRGFSHGFVHLPVAGDDQFAFFVHAKNYLSERAATPGSSLPSRNSRLAPPPVLMNVT